jgi:hypothetical protein
MPRCASAWRATWPRSDGRAEAPGGNLSEWWTYTPADFLMFAPRIYWRLFDALNRQTWPAALLAPAAAVAWLLWVARGVARPGAAAARLAAVGLALAWTVSGLLFLRPLLAPIHWLVEWIAPVFVLQALLLTALAATGGLQATASTRRRRTGLGLLGYALLLHPLWPLLDGRPLSQAETFGLAPDPTALATLGVLLLWHAGTPVGRLLGRFAWGPPLAWCALSAATLWTMGSAQGWALAGGAALALAAARRHGL